MSTQLRARATRSMGVAVIAAAGVLLTGCADVATSDFCTQYGEVVVQAEALRSLEPQTDNVDAIREQANAFRAEVEQLQAVSEGRLDRSISALRLALNDLRNQAVDASEEALEAARPALQDAAEQVQEAWSVLELMAANECSEA